MIVWDQNPMLLEWAGKILGATFDPKQCAWLSIIKDEEISAVVIYNRFSKNNCEMSVASNGKRNWFDRKSAKAFFGYPFNQTKVSRISAIAEQDNIKSINMLRKLGFVEEATLKNWFGDKDAILFRMLRSECKWI